MKIELKLWELKLDLCIKVIRNLFLKSEYEIKLQVLMCSIKYFTREHIQLTLVSKIYFCESIKANKIVF